MSSDRVKERWGFARGFPCSVAQKSAAKVLLDANSQLYADNIDAALQYGRPEGDDYPREAISKFLSNEYGEIVPKSDIFISGGSSLSLFLLGEIVVPGCKFLLEDISYFLGIKSIKNDLRRETVAIKCTSDGVDLEDLEKKMKIEFESCPESQLYSCAFYAIPTFHNPRGICYSPEISSGVVKLAKKYKVLVICDDVYNLLYFGSHEQPRRLRSYAKQNDCSDFVVSIGTFSKILAPGTRLGWIESSSRIYNLLQKFCVPESGCNFGQYQSYVVAKAIENGDLINHIKLLRGLYKTRAEYLANQVTPHLPSASKIAMPKGGYYIWIELPNSLSSQQLHDISMEKYGLDFHCGPKFSVNGGHENCIRLSYSQLTMPELKVATDAFIASLKRYITNLE